MMLIALSGVLRRDFMRFGQMKSVKAMVFCQVVRHRSLSSAPPFRKTLSAVRRDHKASLLKTCLHTVQSTSGGHMS